MGEDRAALCWLRSSIRPGECTTDEQSRSTAVVLFDMRARKMAMTTPDADLQAELEPRMAERGPVFWIEVSEQQATDIASGYVPNAVKAMVTCMLDFRRQDELRAARPVPKKKGKP